LHPQRKDPIIEHATANPTLVENEEEASLTDTRRPKRKCVQFDKISSALHELPSRTEKNGKARGLYNKKSKRKSICQNFNVSPAAHVSGTDTPAPKARRFEQASSVQKQLNQTSMSVKECVTSVYSEEESTSTLVRSASEQLPPKQIDHHDVLKQHAPESSDHVQQQMLQILMGLQKEVLDLRTLTSDQQKQLQSVRGESRDLKVCRGQQSDTQSDTHIVPTSLLEIVSRPNLPQLTIFEFNMILKILTLYFKRKSCGSTTSQQCVSSEERIISRFAFRTCYVAYIY